MLVKSCKSPSEVKLQAPKYTELKSLTDFTMACDLTHRNEYCGFFLDYRIIHQSRGIGIIVFGAGL